MTGEDLSLKPSTVEQANFEYSPLSKIFNKGFDKDEEEDKKEGILKKLKNIERNQKSNNNNNNNNRNNLSSAKIESSSARSESSTKTLFNDGETQTSFKYLKDNTE